MKADPDLDDRSRGEGMARCRPDRAIEMSPKRSWTCGWVWVKENGGVLVECRLGTSTFRSYLVRYGRSREGWVVLPDPAVGCPYSEERRIHSWTTFFGVKFGMHRTTASARATPATTSLGLPNET